MTTTESYSYVGGELGLFMNATNWKRYWAGRLKPFVHGRVLDVGAGLGASFDYLSEGATHWTCLEPDQTLCTQLEARLARHPRPPSVRCGTLDTLGSEERFDSIVYIDVLEHIEHDREQLERAARHLEPGGALLVLSPAMPSLYSPFDRSVGHFRRYTKDALKRLSPAGLRIKNWFFLDGLGVLASLFARLARRSAPTQAQIMIWDRTIVPVSRITDVITSSWFGRTIVMVWVKE
jgi:SAM-dependent methyltransferase